MQKFVSAVGLVPVFSNPVFAYQPLLGLQSGSRSAAE